MAVAVQQQETYPWLATMDYYRRWLDGFVSILESYLVSLSSPLLTIGIGFSMMDFLTQGQLLQNATIGVIWAFIQTAAVDCQFISMWYKSKIAFQNKHYWQLTGYVILGLVLAFVAFGANAIPSLQHATGVNFSTALQSLGFDTNSLVYARSGVSIVLAIIAAWTRTVVLFDKPQNLQVPDVKSEEESLQQEAENYPEIITEDETMENDSVSDFLNSEEVQELTVSPKVTQPLNKQEVDTGEIKTVNKRVTTSRTRRVPTKSERVMKLLKQKPDLKNVEIAKKVNASVAYVSQIRSQMSA